MWGGQLAQGLHCSVSLSISTSLVSTKDVQWVLWLLLLLTPQWTQTHQIAGELYSEPGSFHGIPERQHCTPG